MRYDLTVLARSILLLTCCFLFNVACWVVAGILFGRHQSTRSILSLCLLAWTTGLRHGLDADHISAIDNATRTLVGLNQLPITCGLYFSLGHSTIVIAVNIAIAISSSVYNRIGGVGNVGGIVGTAISGSFLFIVGLANSIILWRILLRRRRMVRSFRHDENMLEQDKHETSGIVMRVIGPVTTFVNKPWKMYPVGVLFGFGFDTASSIALLAITALARKGANGQSIAQGDIVILPFLFTAGMTIVDSADSVLMLFSYAGFTDQNKWALVKRKSHRDAEPPLVQYKNPSELDEKVENKEDTGPSRTALNYDAISELLPIDHLPHAQIQPPATHMTEKPILCKSTHAKPPSDSIEPLQEPDSIQLERTMRIKRNTMSNLSIALTLISILVALSISLIEIMGLIGQECGSCQRAANSEDGGGLAGSWWRGWEKANDNSGFIGAAIVGGFVALVASWYMAAWAVKRWKGKNERNSESDRPNVGCSQYTAS
ncbi:NicO-domain-containing protein [Ramaria rubella]|nr:NicO-domain-containing protein [Ramaria rubella]